MMNYGYPYGNYPQYPYGYQGQMQQRGQMANTMPPQQPIQQQPQPLMQAQFEIPLRETKFVTSEEAKAYIVMPNSASLLIDKQQGLAYLKTADNMGQSFMECYSFKKQDGKQSQEMPQNQAKEEETDKLSSYVKKDEIGAFNFATKDDLAKIQTRLEQLSKIAMGIKPNSATNQTK